MEQPNARRLQIAREYAGLTQTELAKTIGVSQSTISKAEKGYADLDKPILTKLARVCGLHPSFFQGANDLSVQIPGAFYRRRKQVSKKIMRQLEGRLAVVRQGISTLLDAIDLQSPLAVPDASGSEPEYAAGLLRDVWSMPSGPVASMTEYLEGAGVIIAPLRSHIEKFDAISFREDRNNPPMIFIRHGLPGDRQRFTLAHELGHLVLHRRPGLDVDHDRIEEEANRFAAEFLMPRTDIRPSLSNIDVRRAAQLKCYWRTAMSSIIRRARDTKAIDQTRYTSLMVMMSRRGYRKAEPLPIEPEQPKLLGNILRVHLEDLEYTHAELARLLCVTPNTLDHEFLPDDMRSHKRVVAIAPQRPSAPQIGSPSSNVASITNIEDWKSRPA